LKHKESYDNAGILTHDFENSTGSFLHLSDFTNVKNNVMGLEGLMEKSSRNGFAMITEDAACLWRSRFSTRWPFFRISSNVLLLRSYTGSLRLNQNLDL
jgi:hypothetical protein